MQFSKSFDKLYGVNDHLLPSLAASMIAHLLHPIIMFLGTFMELGVHNPLISAELNVRI
jgi:hypothetical protein